MLTVLLLLLRLTLGTWTKIPREWPHEFIRDGLPRSIRWLFTEVLVWANDNGTDGRFPRYALRYATDLSEDDAHAGLDELVKLGRLEVAEDGWWVSNWTEHQEKATVVRARQEQSLLDSKRWRWHKAGDHSLCLADGKCPHGTVPRKTSRQDSREHSRDGVPNSPEQTRPERSGAGSEAGADAPRARPSGAGAPSADPLRSEARSLQATNDETLASLGFSTDPPDYSDELDDDEGDGFGGLAATGGRR